jgi:hypothetical protein
MKVCSFLPDGGIALVFFGVRSDMNVSFCPLTKSYTKRQIFLRREFTIRCLFRYAIYAASIGCFSIPCGNLAAQEAMAAANSGVPQAVQKDAPDAPAPQDQSNGQRDPQTKRILGILPNFRAISTDEKLPAQSVKEKFVTATQDSFDYSSIFIPAMLAGYSLETNATPEFHQGAAGYGRYFWHAAVDQTSENYMVEFVVPSITHEDTRYYTLGSGGFLKRTGYALSRAIVTRSDSGKEVFNISEVVGAGAASGLSSLYYPTRERSFGNTGKEWGMDIGIDSLSFVAKEFWPDINRWLFHGK